MRENMNVPNNLKHLRTINNHSQKQIGIVCGVGESAIGNYEKGIRTPDPITLQKLAMFFNVSIDDLINKDFTSDNISEITPIEFSNQVKALLLKTGNLSEEKKQYIIQTLDLMCNKEDE